MGTEVIKVSLFAIRRGKRGCYISVYWFVITRKL